MADAADLKSAVFGRAGSSPAFGTDGRFARRAGTGEKKNEAYRKRGYARKKSARGRERAPVSGGTVFLLSRVPVAGTKKTFPRDFPAGTFFFKSNKNKKCHNEVSHPEIKKIMQQ